MPSARSRLRHHHIINPIHPRQRRALPDRAHRLQPKIASIGIRRLPQQNLRRLINRPQPDRPLAAIHPPIKPWTRIVRRHRMQPRNQIHRCLGRRHRIKYVPQMRFQILRPLQPKAIRIEFPRWRSFALMLSRGATAAVCQNAGLASPEQGRLLSPVRRSTSCHQVLASRRA